MKTKSNSRGFTLVELISVMVILGVLSAYAVPKMFDFVGTARVKSRAQFKVEVESGLRMYGLHKLTQDGSRKYPPSHNLRMSRVMDEVSVEFSYLPAATAADTGAFKYTNSSEIYYLAYITNADSTSYSTASWLTTPPTGITP